MRRLITTVLVALLVLSVAAVPAVAQEGALSNDTSGSDARSVDECTNSDKGPSGDAGPPGFVADLASPNAVSDLIGRLPVPGFVKGLFGASTC